MLFRSPFAKDIDYAALEVKVATYHPEVLLCQHHETSSGQIFDLQRISAICLKHNVSLVVDAISSFLTDPLDMDQLGIDICITSSQKGLNIAPGLSFIFLSERLTDYKFNHKGYYFDFEENLNNLKRGQTPYSPATTLFMQLHARLKKIMAQGINHVIETVAANAIFFRTLCRENGWEILCDTPSNCITGFMTGDKDRKIFTTLLEKDIMIMPGGKSGFYRVSHLGEQTTDELKELAAEIKNIELEYKKHE